MKLSTPFTVLSLIAITSVAQAADGPCRVHANRPAVPTTVAQVRRAPSARPMNKVMANRPVQGDIIQTAVGPGMQTVTTLVKAVQAAELVDALRAEGPFTVFAPTNDAFAKLPEETLHELLQPENKAKLQSILLYHVHAGKAIRANELRDGELSTAYGQPLQVAVDGPTVMVNNATVTKTDVTATNGVIHWIDTVILPGEMHSEEMMDSQAGDIIQTAVGPGMQTVTTLVKAVQAAELVDALRGPGPFTVFAPTNDAFAKLPPETIESLLKPENRAQLQSILLYHVHAGEAIASADLQGGQLTTLNGKPISVTVDGPTKMVENATITKTDVMASNGVIHWLDTVILP